MTRWKFGALALLISVLLMSSAVFAQQSDQEFKEAVEELRSQTIEMIESVPDLTQIATQASQEQIGQGQPVLEEQLVYSVSPWTGREYGGTFAARQASTVFLMADATSIVNSQRTKVYFWPITGEYMADWFEMREDVPGTLEIVQNGNVIRTFEKTQYSYYFPSGYGSEQQLFLGDEAQKVFDDYQSRINAFYDATSQYYVDYREWQLTMDRILKEVQETGIYKDPDEIPPAPKQPTPPSDFAYAPRISFAVNLPVGNYTMRLRGEDGQIVPGSERRLEVFAPRRVGVSYEVIPAHKWTRRMRSNELSQVFYQDGERIFYLIPSHAREFNFYQYVKMANLHKPLEGEGTRSAWTWASFGEIDEGTIQILKDGQVVSNVELLPYYVKQTPGYALGYDIIDFDPQADPTLANRAPTFHGYKVQVPADGVYQLRLVDAAGNVIPGSEREIRPVEAPGLPAYLISLVPFGVGAIIFAWRRSKKSKGRAESI